MKSTTTSGTKEIVLSPSIAGHAIDIYQVWAGHRTQSLCLLVIPNDADALRWYRRIVRANALRGISSSDIFAWQSEVLAANKAHAIASFGKEVTNRA